MFSLLRVIEGGDGKDWSLQPREACVSARTPGTATSFPDLKWRTVLLQPYSRHSDTQDGREIRLFSYLPGSVSGGWD